MKKEKFETHNTKFFPIFSGRNNNHKYAKLTVTVRNEQNKWWTKQKISEKSTESNDNFSFDTWLGILVRKKNILYFFYLEKWIFWKVLHSLMTFIL